MEIISFVLVLSFAIPGLKNFLLRILRPAVPNNDLPDRVIKKHGRWKSEKAKDTYCREDIQHQLLVTLNIGILRFSAFPRASLFLIIAGGSLHYLLYFLSPILIIEMFSIRLSEAK